MCEIFVRLLAVMPKASKKSREAKARHQRGRVFILVPLSHRVMNMNQQVVIWVQTLAVMKMKVLELLCPQKWK